MSLTQINKAGLDEIALDHVFTIGASGTDHYTFQGEGLNGTVNDPTLYLTRGKTYRFENGTGAHAIRIQSADDGTSGTLYNTGVTNNNTTGTVIVEVQHDAPDVLYYQCASHANMKGTIYVTGALADGGVTTAKLANDAVTADKIANNSITSAKIADASILQNDISDNAISTAKLQNDLIISSKIADDAIGNEHLADNCVNAAQIADGQVTSAKIGANQVTSAKIAPANVTTTQIADDAVTGAKIAAEIDNSHITSSANIAGSKLADNSISLAKLEHGTSSNNGKFLRANNGADPTFETVSAGPTIANQADNRVITATGTTDALNAESGVVIDSSGNLGIGTTSPAQSLHVHDSTSYQGVILSGNGAPRIGFANASVGTSGANGGAWSCGIDGTNGDNFVINNSNNNSNTKILLSSTLNTMTQNTQINGNLKFGSSGNGIDFSSHSQVGSNNTSTSAILDDYEEGTWTPRIQGTTGAGTASYNTAYGRYVKIGNFVHISGNLNWTSGSAGGEMQIGNLPFTPVANNEGVGNMMGHVLDTHSAVNICVYAGAGVYYAYLYQTRDNQGWVTINYDNDGAIIFNVAFRVA